MNTLQTTLHTLAALLEYPGRGFEQLLIGGVMADAAAPAWRRFKEAIKALGPDEREELYTSTFDVTPACIPYVSIHLFGEENFKRGEFMAGLQARYQQSGFHAAGELPDHLSVILRYAALTEGAETRDLAEFCLLGPVNKMIVSLSEANPYRALLETVRDTMQAAYPDLEPAPSPLDQMRQHGLPCPSTSAGCGCGPVGLRGGPHDDFDVPDANAPGLGAGGRIPTIESL